ncbi:acylphosphatase [Legionella jamestowniensis]|uniref:Acylphosphatase n=1 Tax=Legionella jamestowniensis TaxID=455 RepID=A0A0W0UNQ8_9GAMM|nr:acylphosphatase [Legionella jamestowniensis]KTD09502.1 acylphosphatase [Legionella jamestowniensis]OCH98679.1 acylphosphatase [Legionella jamestowniensis]SFL90380.1 acylphosphatase [Legionella jamestowniensis DSM 19215]
MSKQLCMHCYISGKVQGVWFRASAQEEAKKLGINGWARNLADGRVEILACGDQKQLEKFEHWLKNGPPLAEITSYSREDLAWKEYSGFDTF